MQTAVASWLAGEGEEFFKDIGIGEGQSVLDFGCGDGFYTIPAARVVGEKGKVYALDKEDTALYHVMERARVEGLRNIEPMRIRPGTSGIGLEKGSVDFMLLYDVLHYMDAGERKGIYKNGREILKNGGILSVYPKHCRSDESLWNLAAMDVDDIVKEIEGAKFFLERTIRRMLIHDKEYTTGRILNFRK